MQRPYAYDRAYIASRVELGHEVVIDGKTYKGGDALPTQAELDKLMERDGLAPKDLSPVDPLVPHGDPANEPIAEVKKSTADTLATADGPRAGGDAEKE